MPVEVPKPLRSRLAQVAVVVLAVVAFYASSLTFGLRE
jgi:hypothetical protein